MGATNCKCCEKENEIVDAQAMAPANAYSDEVETKEPIMSVTTMERPPEQTGAECDSREAEAKFASSDASSDMEDLELGTRKFEFEIEPGQPLGARFAELREPVSQGGSLVATSIANKAPLAFTKTGQTGICAGDVIKTVNGEGGSKARLLKLLTQAKTQGGTTEIVVQLRPRSFDVLLQKTSADQKMGVVVAVHDDIENKVEVRQISDDGAVLVYNEKNYSQQVVAGDWILAVNGIQRSANDMILDMQDAWKNGQPLVFQVKSYPTEEMRNSQVVTK
mmetsp:Transcript_90207/g.254505  ORF Transcript_90207/g.254505 Transcript_90207/m.254505 type:complete len:278 (-) Transcript_90207:80-913(-)